MDRRFRIVSFITIIALVLSFGLTFSVQAQSTDPGGVDDPGAVKDQAAGVVVKEISAKDQAAALKAWTRKAIAAAQPLEIDVVQGAAEAPALEEAALMETANAEPAGFAPSGGAAANATAIAQRVYARDWAALSKADTAEMTADATADEMVGTSQVYDSFYLNYYVPLQTIYPHRWVGRLSFRTPSGTSYCSATAISNNIMLTAAHCVYDSTANVWYSGWVFSPAYRNGATPYGSYPATRCWVLTAWVNLVGAYAINTWTRHDVAVCKMGPNSAGQGLNNMVGWMGRQWNVLTYVRHFFNLGYPFRDYTLTNLPYPGQYLLGCAAESFAQTTDTYGMGCNWGPGISGGPWVINYKPAVVSGWANSVNSGLFVNTANLYGARFMSYNIGLLCTAAVC
jgi:V8-like Glu-specific endopeptidase